MSTDVLLSILAIWALVASLGFAVQSQRVQTLEEIMADDKTQLDEVVGSIRDGISGAADRFNSKIADLEARLAAVPNAPDLSSEIAALQQEAADLKSLGADVAPPAPAPAPEPAPAPAGP